jgi:hypothetical protein
MISNYRVQRTVNAGFYFVCFRNSQHAFILVIIQSTITNDADNHHQIFSPGRVTKKSPAPLPPPVSASPKPVSVKSRQAPKLNERQQPSSSCTFVQQT